MSDTQSFARLLPNRRATHNFFFADDFQMTISMYLHVSPESSAGCKDDEEQSNKKQMNTHIHIGSPLFF